MCRLQIEKQLVDCITVSKLWLAVAAQPQHVIREKEMPILPIFLPLVLTFQAVFLIMPILIPNPPPYNNLHRKGTPKHMVYGYGFGFLTTCIQPFSSFPHNLKKGAPIIFPSLVSQILLISFSSCVGFSFCPKWAF